jgi:hypothetical protein
MLEDGTWNYPSSTETLEKGGLLTIQEYIEKRKQTVTTYIQSTSIYKECINSTLSPCNNMQIVWWQSLENEKSENE